MRYVLNHVVNWLDRMEHRLTRCRPGSILIIVIVLIVMLALMGTAFLSSARNDRYVSAQNTANTQIDLLVDGVEEMARSAILGDLSGTYNGGAASLYRPPLDTSNGTLTTNTYSPWTAPDVVTTFTDSTFPPQNQKWLSLRLPQVVNELIPAVKPPANSVGGGTNAPYWAAIASPVLSGAPFDSPGVFSSNTGAAASGVGTVYNQRITTTAAPLNPTSVTVNGSTYPAWYLPSPTNPGVFSYYIAADADGDGIADSGLFKLPVGTIAGVTYYAAVRIVDNNSAINVNTAMSRSYDFDFTGATVDPLGVSTSTFLDNLGWFQSHVGLFETLRRANSPPGTPLTTGTWGDANTTNELLALNRYRYGYASNATLSAAGLAGSDVMVLDPNIAPNTANPNPVIYGGATAATFTTQGDMLQNQLTRRISGPGYITPTGGAPFQLCKAFSVSDAAALAYHFTLINPSGSMSTLESTFYNAATTPASFADSVYRSASNYSGTVPGQPGHIAGRSAYTPVDVDWWYNENFGMAGTSTTPGRWPTARSILTAYSPTTNLIQVKGSPQPTSVTAPPSVGLPNVLMTAYRATPAKTSINTATDASPSVLAANFGELWRAFWCVMSENQNTTRTPFITADSIKTIADLYHGEEFDLPSPENTRPPAFNILSSTTDPQYMFRNSIRDFHLTSVTYLLSGDELLMRAAIAAVQAMQIRAEGISAAAAPATFQQITLPVTGPTGKNQSVNVTVYGNQPQPFITEVYAQTDTFNQENGLGPNPDGYMAIELYNPYSQDIKLDNSYDIIAVQKSTGTGPYPLTITPVYTFDGSITVPKNNFVVLTNDDALYQPASAGVVKNNHPIPLEKAYDQELIIRRNIGTSASPQYYAVDSFDFTGLRQGRLNLDSLGNEIARLWHYVRAAGPGTNNWKCVYPGRYNGVASSDTTNANSPPRQQGTDEPWAFQESRNAPGWTEKTATDPWAGGPPSTEQHAAFTLGSANDVATYPNVFTIQLPDLNWPGPNSLAAANNQFPFGGFARNGDMLQIPFIGAYTIDNGNGQTAGLIEMNSISMDAAFAEDTDVTDDEPEQGIADTGAQPREQIGRFCPIYHDPVGFAGLLADDYGTNVANYRYAWAKKLFDYLTVQAPQDDYLPNVTTNQATSAGAPAPQAVDNDGDGQANATTAIPPVDTEDAYPVHGLININTAPWRVLAALPIFPTGDANTYNTTTFGWTAGPNPGIDDNAELAQAIVHWRDGDPANNLPGNGPFRSIFDLYNVPAFRNAQHQIFATTAKDPGNADGDFSPVGPTADGTRYDFEEQFLLLNKISNLITTRSDSFTVYVLVQGWKGVGTNNPQLVVQRRAAFIQDRSPVTQTSKSLPAAVSVPNN